MSEPALRDATYDDLLKVPDHLVAELIDGELFTSPRPASPHARTSSVLGRKVGAPFDDGEGGPGGWWIIDEPELHSGLDVLVPDLAGWRRERMPIFPDAPWFELSPDWLCEVVSPSTGRLDRMRKMPKYAANGVSYLWIVDPLQQLIESYRLREGQWVLLGVYGGGDKARIEPFDAIEIGLSSLWIERAGR